jgi:hypothetical protein
MFGTRFGVVDRLPGEVDELSDRFAASGATGSSASEGGHAVECDVSALEGRILSQCMNQVGRSFQISRLETFGEVHIDPLEYLPPTRTISQIAQQRGKVDRCAQLE